jgi:Xaa-Pro aminopeptidase
VILSFNQSVPDFGFYHLSGIEEPCNGVAVFDGRKALVLASPLEAEVCRKYAETVVYRNSKEFWEMLKRETRGQDKVGLNFRRLPLFVYDELKKKLECGFFDASAELEARRVVKSSGEVEKIRQACGIADRCIVGIRDFLRPGITEAEIRAELEYLAMKGGADKMGFDTIVASGKNSSIPHHVTSSRKLKEGDAVLIDFGPQSRMYCSDMSRTFVLGRNPEFIQEYTTVLQTLQGLEKMMEAGRQMNEVQERADKCLGQKVHSVGHGVGLEVHEAPSFSSNKPLRRGMVLAVEPAVYRDFGIRLEDVFLVDKKAKRLTTAPRDIDFAVI